MIHQPLTPLLSLRSMGGWEGVSRTAVGGGGGAEEGMIRWLAQKQDRPITGGLGAVPPSARPLPVNEPVQIMTISNRDWQHPRENLALTCTQGGGVEGKEGRGDKRGALG